MSQPNIALQSYPDPRILAAAPPRPAQQAESLFNVTRQEYVLPVTRGGELHGQVSTTGAELQQPSSVSGQRVETRGRKGYRWLNTITRKVERVRQALPEIPFGKVCKALYAAGGPSESVTRKKIDEIAGPRATQEGLLRSSEGKKERQQLLRRQAGHHHWPAGDVQLPTTLDDSRRLGEPLVPALDTVTSHGGFYQSSEAHTNLQLPCLLPISAQQSPSCPPSASSETTPTVRPNQTKRRRDESSGPAFSSGPTKEARNRPPRSDAAEVDVELFGQHLAEEYPDCPPDRIHYVLRHMSAAFSSGSSHVIPDDLSRRSSMRRSGANTAAVPGLSLCELLASAPVGGGLAVATDVYTALVNGANVNESTADGETALHIAVKRGFDAVCGILLWAGASPEAKTYAGLDIWGNAKPAWKASGRRNPNDRLYSMIFKCMNLVCHGLRDIPVDKRAISRELLDLCAQLDADEGRRARRWDEHVIRQEQLPITQRTSLQTINEASVSPTNGVYEAAVTAVSYCPDLTPRTALTSALKPNSPESLDSGYQGSPNSLPGMIGPSMMQGLAPEMAPPVMAHGESLRLTDSDVLPASHTHQPPYAPSWPQGQGIAAHPNSAEVTNMVLGAFSGPQPSHLPTAYMVPRQLGQEMFLSGALQHTDVYENAPEIVQEWSSIPLGVDAPSQPSSDSALYFPPTSQHAHAVQTTHPTTFAAAQNGQEFVPYPLDTRNGTQGISTTVGVTPWSTADAETTLQHSASDFGGSGVTQLQLDPSPSALHGVQALIALYEAQLARLRGQNRF
jgi:hypothetical protein